MNLPLRKVACLLLLSCMAAIGITSAQPSFSSTPVTTATVGTPYTYGISATDPSNNTLNFTAATLPPWLTLSNNGQSTATQFGGTVSQPGGIAGDDQGNIYVTSLNTTTIYKIAPDGTTTTWFTRQSGSVYGMYVHAGFLYISYYYNNVVGASKINKVSLSNPSAGEVTVYQNPVSSTSSFLSMTQKDGFLYVAMYQQSKVIRINLSTNVASDYIANIPYPFGLGFNSAGILYIASYLTGSIYSFNPATTALSQILTGITNPSDIKIDAYDNAYISGIGYVRKYTPNLSSYVTSYTSSGAIWGMSITPTGALVFGDNIGSRVAKLQTGANLSGTPPASALGLNNVVINVSNGTASSSQSFTITVRSAPTIAAMPNISRAVNMGPVTLTDPASNSTGTFTYTSSNPSIVSVSGNNLILNNAGTVTITANQAAAGFYNAGSTSFTLTVTAAALNPAGALNFVKANNTYISVPHSSSLNLGAEFTIESWVNYTGTNSTIVDKGNYNYLLQVNCDNAGFPPNRLNFYNRNTGWVNSTGTVPEGVWTHVAVTLKNGTMTFYINGVASGTAAVSFAQDSGPVNIGRQSPSSCACNVFNGNMDELRIWNRALSACEINANKSCELTGTQTALAAYYKFNQGNISANNSTVNTLTDASGNSNTGTLTNFALTGSSANWVAGQVSGNCAVFTAPTAPITGSLLACAGSSVQLSNAATGGQWSSSNQAVATISANGLVSAIAAGTTTISYTTDCGGVSTAVFTVNALPTVNQVQNQEVCHNAVPVTAITFGGNLSGTTYSWTNSNASIGLAASGTGDIASFTALNPGTAPVYATITVTPSYTNAGNTCTGAPMSFVIRVNPIPVINPIAAQTLCNGATSAPINLSSPVAGSVFKWTNITPSINIGLPNGEGDVIPSFTAINTGSASVTPTYYITSYFQGETMGCGTTWQLDFTVHPTPTATITASGPTTFCTGGTVTLTASAGAAYLWSNGAQTPSITVSQAGNYSVTVTSAAGCTATSAPTAVVVNALPSVPVINTGGTTLLCTGGSLTLSAAAVGAGKAVEFDGSNDNIVIPNNAAFNFTSQYTVESWINVRSYQYGTIIAKFEDDNNNRGWMVNMGETGDATKIHVVHSRLGSWTNPIQWNSGFQPQLNTWYHIAVVFDASLSSNQIKLYVNGALTAQTSWPYTITPNSANMYIGGYDGPGNGVNGGANSRFFNGRVDEVRVWNVARTAPEISANFNQVISTPTTGLVAGYSFSELTGNAVQDVTGVNNGTLVNAPTRISTGPALAGAGNNTYLWSTGTTGASITVNQPGTYTVTATNENGCAATSAPVNITNYPAPTISCPGNISVASAANQCGATVTYPAATIPAGLSTPTSIQYSHPSGSFFPVGNTTVTATVTDGCGNTASCTFIVTVRDEIPPVLACTNQASSTPVNLMRGASTGGTASIVSWGAMNGAAQYGGSSLGTTCNEAWRPFGTLCDETPNTNSMTTSTKVNANSGITWGSGGANGVGIFVVDLGSVQTFNLAQVYQMFSDGKTTHVRGFYHPSTAATAPSLTDAGWVELFPETLIGAGVLSGNNVTQPTNINFTSTTARYIRFYARNDGRYGSTSYIETRSIKLFSTAPAVNNVVVNAAYGQCNAIATYDVQAIDNCPGTVVSYSIPSGSSFPIGTTPVTVTATDASGNVATCSFSVIVNAPEVNVVGNASNIPNGSTMASPTNNTNLGGVLPNTQASKNFVVQNTGTAPLLINSINLAGVDAASFSISGITLPATVAPSATTSFNVVFNSNTPGVKQAQVVINNGDCDEATYQFAVSAEVVCTFPAFSNTATQIQGATPVTACQAMVTYPLAVTGIPTPSVSYVLTGATSGSGSGTGSGLLFNKGLTHVVVTAVNSCSTVINEFDVIVADVVPPVAIAQHLTVSLNATGTASITAAQINNGSTDNCGIASISIDKTNFDCSNVGANTVILTVTDVNGNSATASAVVTVVDTIAPTAIAQQLTVSLNATGTATITAAQINNGSTDNCGIASISIDKTNFDCSNVGTNTVILTVTDVNGNSATASAVVTVVDTIAPTAIAQHLTVSLNATGTATITAAQINNGSTDNCGIASISIDKTNFDCSNVGANTVILTVTDVNGNSATASAVVTVVDAIAPTVIAHHLTVSLNATGTATITAAQINNGSTDNCGIASISIDKTNFDCSNVGTNTVILTVTDVNGNSATASAVVTVVDTIAPTAIAQQLTVSLNANGTATITAAQINNGSTDNCGIASISIDKTSFDCSKVGANTVILTVTDVNGNSATASAVVTVVDTIAPTAIAQQLTVSLNATGTATITAAQINNGSTDNCGITSISIDKTSFDCSNVGANTVILTVTDVNGNSATASAVVTVVDLIAPGIIAPAAISQGTDSGVCGATVVLGTPVTSDNCGVASVTNNAPALFPVGTTVVTWTVTDVNGNTNTTTQTVVIADNEKPMIIAPGMISVVNASGSCTATVDLGTPVTSDNCGVASVTNNAPALFPVGTTIVTWKVTDIHGNVNDTATQYVVVIDNEMPTVSIANRSVNSDAGKCGATINIGLPATSDNCGIASVIGVRSDAKLLTEDYPVGITTIVWTVRDVNGNTKSITQTITVSDLEKPVVQCAVNQVFCANTGGNTQYTIPALSITDNCGIASVTYAITGVTNRTGTGVNASGSFAIGTSTVTYTVRDIHGNVSTCSFTVTINPLPVASITAASANALCNQFTLTANSTLSGPYSYQWLYNNTTKAVTQQLSLGLTDADGVYSVYTRDVNGCRSELPATYNYQKQNLVNSYTILGFKEVKLGEHDKVQTGSVGVMSSRGEAEFDNYSAVTGAGSFVKAPRIDTDRGVTINSKVYGIASVTLPTMQYNTSSTRYLQDKTINSNVTVTVSGNYDEVTLKKGANVTLTGNVFGKIKLEEGASVRFTSAVIDLEELQIDKGPKTSGYSYVRFVPNTVVRVSKKVFIGSDVIVNPEAYQVTFFMADNKRDEEKFYVKGDDTRITANIILPDGKIKVSGAKYGDDRCDHRAHSYKDCRHRSHGHHDCDHRSHDERNCDDDVYMTGLFIAEEVESEGKGVIWNSYNCAAPLVPVTTVTANNGQVAVVKEEAANDKLSDTRPAADELTVTVMPNPSRTYFKLKLQSSDQTPVSLRVMDASGRVVEGRTKLGANSTIQIGHQYHSGNYFAELIQGNRRKVVQLIKL